jgi:hypothetical protein
MRVASVCDRHEFDPKDRAAQDMAKIVPPTDPSRC